MKLTSQEYLIVTHGFRYTLDISGSVQTFVGIVRIFHSFDEKSKTLITGSGSSRNFCEENYSIKISVSDSKGIIVTILNEVRLERSAENHIYPDWTCCLCAPQDLIVRLSNPDGFDMRDFYDNIIIPFFYNQSFHLRHGKWILGEYGHGDNGVFERYSREKNPGRRFTDVTLSTLSPAGFRLVLNGNVICQGMSPECIQGLTKLRNDARKNLLLNFK